MELSSRLSEENNLSIMLKVLKVKSISLVPPEQDLLLMVVILLYCCCFEYLQYNKPAEILEMEKKVQEEISNLKSSEDGDVDCKQS